MKINFFQADNSNWGNLQADLSKAIREYLNCGKDFEVEFSEVKASKSWLQLKGIHRLCQLLAVRLTESNGITYSMENAKDFIKWRLGFTEKVSEEQALAEAINEKNKILQSGEEMTRQEFVDLVSEFKETLMKPRSFATATKDEMMGLIQGIEQLGNTMGWKELKLTSVELQGLVEYYNNKEK